MKKLEITWKDSIISLTILATTFLLCLLLHKFESFYGRRADKKRKLFNGMIPCQLYQFFKPAFLKENNAMKRDDFSWKKKES